MTFTNEYKAAVTALADKKQNRRFLNDSADHAKLISDLMIGRACEDDEVFIYSGALGKGCYDESIQNSKARQIRVLLDDKAGLEGYELRLNVVPV